MTVHVTLPDRGRLGLLHPGLEQTSDVLHRLAGTFLSLGDDRRCEAAARAAIKAEKQCERPAMLGNHLMFLANFLHERGRKAEALVAACEAQAGDYEVNFGGLS